MSVSELVAAVDRWEAMLDQILGQTGRGAQVESALGIQLARPRLKLDRQAIAPLKAMAERDDLPPGVRERAERLLRRTRALM